MKQELKCLQLMLLSSCLVRTVLRSICMIPIYIHVFKCKCNPNLLTFSFCTRGSVGRADENSQDERYDYNIPNFMLPRFTTWVATWHMDPLWYYCFIIVVCLTGDLVENFLNKILVLHRVMKKL